MAIRGIRGIGKVAGIPKLGDEPRTRVAQKGGIPIAPRGAIQWAPAEDPLEKAAMQGVPGTLPERIVWKWLEDNQYSYLAQSSEGGGRLTMGGAVIDFLVFDIAGKPVALRVQGDYWHGPKFPDRQARDDEQYYRLTEWGYLVVDLWESDIYEAARHKRVGPYIMGEIET